jgi:hypothetical protein
MARTFGDGEGVVLAVEERKDVGSKEGTGRGVPADRVVQDQERHVQAVQPRARSAGQHWPQQIRESQTRQGDDRQGGHGQTECDRATGALCRRRRPRRRALMFLGNLQLALWSRPFPGLC